MPGQRINREGPRKHQEPECKLRLAHDPVKSLATMELGL